MVAEGYINSLEPYSANVKHTVSPQSPIWLLFDPEAVATVVSSGVEVLACVDPHWISLSTADSGLLKQGKTALANHYRFALLAANAK